MNHDETQSGGEMQSRAYDGNVDIEAAETTNIPIDFRFLPDAYGVSV
jgi:hypothetical protein